jgi:ribonuclease HI
LFFDGASRRNTGVAGVKGTLYYPKGTTIETFSYGLGIAPNNIAKVYALIQGLQLTKESKVKSLITFGDFMAIV